MVALVRIFAGGFFLVPITAVSPPEPQDAGRTTGLLRKERLEPEKDAALTEGHGESRYGSKFGRSLEADRTCHHFLNESSITFDVSDKPVAMLQQPIKAALFAVVVKTPDYHKSYYNIVELGRGLFRSAVAVGSKLPMHLMAAGLTEDEILKFTAMNVTVHDFTHEVDKFKGWYHPVYTSADASEHHRTWVENNMVQDRKDGWATYFKLQAWASSFDYVLHVDVDFSFRKNLDNLIDAAAHDGISFLTCNETRKNYNGFNTHIMILRPSQRTYEQLVKKASTGDYVPYTNTEQDVLECFFPVEQSLAKGKYSSLCEI